ncbi:kinase-like domain-containing protein, partial [Rhizophagus diaphanus]
MSDNTEFEVINNSKELLNRIEEAIVTNHFKQYEYKNFNNIKEIDTGEFIKVYRASWKNSSQYVTLKYFFKLNDTVVEEIIREIKLYRDDDFHNNIIRFHGITKSESENYDVGYWLVMEYADGGTLRSYLKKNFGGLTWENKYNLAYQLACAVLYLHDKGVAHRDLHSNSVLIHQNTIKLEDFGLSKRIKETFNSQSNLEDDIVPYIDPKIFNKPGNNDNSTKLYTLNKKSDVYSVGIILWELSSGKQPFYIEGEQYDINLAVKISQGLREKIIPDTPEDYVNLYSECWNNEPDDRPTIKQVVEKLKAIIKKSDIIREDNQTDNSINDNILSKKDLRH